MFKCNIFDGRFYEFFEVKGVMSMRNLTILITILIASIIVIYLTLAGLLTWEIFLGYLGAGGGVYSFGKWQDDKTRRNEMNNQQDGDDGSNNIDGSSQLSKE